MSKMKTKKVNVFVAIMLIIVLTFANICALGMNVAQSLAAGIAKGNEVKDEVEFLTYFNGVENNGKSCVANVDAKDLKLNLEIKVNSGYLQNSVIIFENPNFKLVNDVSVIPQVSDDKVTQEMINAIQGVDVNNGCIYVNQLYKDTNIKIQVSLESITNNMVQSTYFNKNTNIKLEGTLIDEKGNDKTLSKEEQINLTWHGTATGKVNEQILKYVPYNVNNQKGVIVETAIGAGVENNTLPVNQINMQVIVPSINNIKPKTIEVISNSNQKIDWTNSEDVLNINMINEVNSLNQINWDRNNLNTINVICKYGEDAYDSIMELDGTLKEVTLKQQVSGNVNLYNNEDTSVEIKAEDNFVVNQKIGDITVFNTNDNGQVNKGYLYTNVGIDTLYTVNYNVDIVNKDIVDKIVLESGIDSLVMNDGTEYSLKQDDVYYSKYVTSKIAKSEFLNILGESGKIEIYNGDTIITTIDNNTVVDDNGNIIINYLYDINNLRIVTSKPINDGRLNIYTTKKISGLNLNNDIVKNIVAIRNTTIGKAKLEIKAIDENTKEENIVSNDIVLNTNVKDISMIEPITQARIEMNNASLSTIIDNNNIELRAILKSNDVTSMLYKDPTIEIILPEEFEQFNVNNVKLLFTDELNIDSATLETNENGRKVIKIVLKGTQTNYIQNNLSEGPMVVINANIVVNKMTPSSKKDIEMYVINNNDLYNMNYENNVEGRGKVTSEVEFVGPSGLFTANTVVDENNEVNSVKGEENLQQIETESKSKVSTMKLTLINNNKDICTDIKILGRTPFKGNKNVETGEDLGSTFTAPLVSGIRSADIDMNNMTVYYSYKEEATNEMIEENAWTTTPEDLSKVRSYLIVLDGALVSGAKITFEYDVLVPDNLGFDASTKGTYKVDYNLVSKNKVILRDTTMAESVGMTTQSAPNLSIVVSSDKGDNSVREQEYVKYSISVTNNGSEPVYDAIVSSKVPDNTTYVEYDEIADYSNVHYTLDSNKKDVNFNIDVLNPTETKVFNYIVQVNNLDINVEDICNDPTHYSDELTYEGEGEDDTEIVDEDEVEGRKEHLEEYVHELSEFKKDISTSASVKVSGYEITSDEYKITAQRGYLNIQLSSDPIDTFNLVKDNEIKYNAKITNISGDRDLSNVVAKIVLPKGVDYEEASLEYYSYNEGKRISTSEGINYDSNSKLLTANIGDLKSTNSEDAVRDETSINFIIKVKVNDDSVNENNSGEVYAQVIVEGKDNLENKDIEKYYSNEVVHKIQKANLSLKVESNIEESKSLNSGDEIQYIATITNDGTGYASNIKLNDIISDIGEFLYGKIVIGDNEIGMVAPNTVFNLAAGETAKVYINVKVKDVSEDSNLTNIVEVESDTTEKITSNAITHKVEKGYDVIKNEDGTVVKVYKINGIAWLDSNKNGSRDEGEKVASNVPVILINSDTGTTIANGKTDSNGKYEINNIPEGGKYNIVFIYDNTRFDLTTYQKAGISEALNSDAIAMNVKVDGTVYKAGVTDTLIFNGRNFNNIDIGLVENQKFDLSLNKGISKVTIKTKDGSEVKEYDSTQMAKIDIPGKSVDGATVAIEYIIKVTNEGAVAGYVKNIVDYMPKDLIFNGELNKGWYTGESGYIYNTSLANTILQPGESKEVKLTLTKQMTEDNLGLIINSAEIGAYSNDQGINDLDSTPQNQKYDEDDYSTAKLVLSIKTGEKLVIFIEIAVLAAAFMGLGIYYIRRKSKEIDTHFKF